MTARLLMVAVAFTFALYAASTFLHILVDPITKTLGS